LRLNHFDAHVRLWLAIARIGTASDRGSHMNLLLAIACLAAPIAFYFYNNPMNHSRWFMIRRFINWFPLGMTYAFLYMGRYNLNVSKNALGSLMSKEEFGTIAAIGTWTYALSFLVNGPLVDRIGGKKGIVIAAVGASIANFLLGGLTFLLLMGRLKVNMVLAYSLLYSLNMYFQSYGAVSIIKVKAYWFHVRERGVFGAIFGTLISMGIYFALDWGQAIVDMTKVSARTAEHSWLAGLIQSIFTLPGGKPVDTTWAVFFIPAVILLFWVVLDYFCIKDTPEQANFPHFDPHDASSGQMHVELSRTDLLKKVFTSRLMMLIAAVGLTTGVLRNGVLQWYFVYANEVKQPGAEFIQQHWGLLLCIFGIIGGFAGGLISDKLFHSRRGPPAVLLCGFTFLMTILMAVSLRSHPLILGAAGLLITMAVIGVHSLMSGTAAADFGGRKATATCSGLVDGFVYLGSGIQSMSLGYLVGHGWYWWPIFLMPFALAGGFLAMKFWHDLPEATKKYIAQQKQKEEVGEKPVAEPLLP
jgi:OPA family glycerol-3-phosphate transporter-like MFS transporter